MEKEEAGPGGHYETWKLTAWEKDLSGRAKAKRPQPGETGIPLAQGELDTARNLANHEMVRHTSRCGTTTEQLLVRLGQIAVNRQDVHAERPTRAEGVSTHKRAQKVHKSWSHDRLLQKSGEAEFTYYILLYIIIMKYIIL